MKNELFRQFYNPISAPQRLVFQERVPVDINTAAILAQAELKGAEIRGDKAGKERAEQKLYGVADLAFDAEREAKAQAEASLAAADQLPPKPTMASHRLDITPDVSQGIGRTIGQIERQGAQVRAEMLAPIAPNWVDKALARFGNPKARADIARYEQWKRSQNLNPYVEEYSQAGTPGARLAVLKRISADLASQLQAASSPNQFLTSYGLESYAGSSDPTFPLQVALTKIMDTPVPESDFWAIVEEAEKMGKPDTTTVARIDKIR